MIAALTVLLVFQLMGEVIARALALPIPGPVVGMTLLLHAWQPRDAHEVLMLAERYPMLLGWIAPHIKRWRDDLERR